MPAGTRTLRSTRRARLLPPVAVAAAVAFVLAASTVTAAVGWTGPRLVGPRNNCADVTAAIDSGGGYHVVAECDGQIRYSLALPDGTWASTSFVPPEGHSDHEPKIAIDGTTVYVAYTRLAFAGCGFDWAGVYYRKRTLPAGTWSAAIPLGRVGDHLQSLRVVGETIYATVDQNNDGYEVFYEEASGDVLRWWLLPDAVGLTSMQVGSDGRARIVYEGANSLRYAVFSGSAFTSSAIPETTANDRRPSLVLDKVNRAHVLWMHTAGPGCALPPPEPALDGTYYATNKTGTWTAAAARRFTPDVGVASLILDVATGRVHALLGTDSGLTFYSKTASGPWSALKLSSAPVNSSVIRLDPGTSRLLAVYARQPDANVSASVFAYTKP